MGTNPWDENEGKFDRPSSSVPRKGEGRFVRGKFVPHLLAQHEFAARLSVPPSDGPVMPPRRKRKPVA